jgi:Putative transposase
MSETAAYLIDNVIPAVPVRQWVLSLPIALRVLLAAQPSLVTTVLQVVRRKITRFLLNQANLKAIEAQNGSPTLIHRFGSAANLNIHLHCLVLDEVCRTSWQCGGDLRIIAAILKRDAIEKILNHLGLPRPPPVAPARGRMALQNL